MLVVDDDRRYVNCNAAACELLGLTKKKILAMMIEDLSAPELRDLAPAMFESFLSEGSQAGPYSLRTRDGNVVNCSYSASANVVPGIHLSILIPEDRVDSELDKADGEPKDKRTVLTPRERQVLSLLALGEDCGSIARILDRSADTVRKQTRSARIRLGARSRSHAIALALQGGQLGLDEANGLIRAYSSGRSGSGDA